MVMVVTFPLTARRRLNSIEFSVASISRNDNGGFDAKRESIVYPSARHEKGDPIGLGEG